MRKFSALAGLCLLLASCGPTWVNPDLDKSLVKTQLAEDKKLCQQETDMMEPGEDNNRRYPMDWVPQEQAINYYENYKIYNTRDAIFENCMNLRGWHQPKGPLQYE